MTYESSGGDVELSDDRVETSRLEYLTFPLGLEFVASTSTLRPFGRVGIEPSVLIDADEFLTVGGERVGDAADTDEWYPSVEWTLAIGGGLRFGERWDVHGTYRHGLTNINDLLNRDEHAFHNRGIALGVTLWLSGVER